MKRIPMIALTVLLLFGVFSAAQAATIIVSGSYGAEIYMSVEPQFAYRISSSDISFEYEEGPQNISLELTSSALYRGDTVQVTSPVSVTLTDEETGRTLPVSICRTGAETVSETDTEVYGFDENGMLEISVTPDWTNARSGFYTGEAHFTLGVASESGFDYEGTAASAVDISLPITANVDCCTITLFVGEGGTVKLTEDGEPLETDAEHRYEFALGRDETAALWLVPDEGYVVGEVLIDPDEGWVTREDDKLVFTQIRADTAVTVTFVPRIASIAMDEHLIEFTPGGDTERKLNATIAPDAASEAPIIWTSSDTGIASVDETGLVIISEDGSCGSTVIRCSAMYNSDVYSECAVVVHSSRQMVLPGALRSIGEEAFANTAADEYILPEGITEIGARAFAGSSAKLVKIMNPDAAVDERAFEGCENVTLLVPAGSSLEPYAKAHNIRCITYEDP